MAKSKTQTSVRVRIEKPKVTRPGVHSKTKTSNHKGSKHYKKKSRGQG